MYLNTTESPLVTITKNPTRNGKLRRLDLSTYDLLLKAGYQIIDYHQAMLFQEREQATLDGRKVKRKDVEYEEFEREVIDTKLDGTQDVVKVVEKIPKRIIIEDEDKEQFREWNGRLSFFKRLSLGRGNVAARWEDVSVAVIP